MDINEIRHIAAEECQQDWDKLEYRDIYHKAFIDGGTFVFNDLQAKYAAVVAELEELQNSIPKLKADAIREAVREVVSGMMNYCGTDLDVECTDELMEYADKLERGEA